VTKTMTEFTINDSSSWIVEGSAANAILQTSAPQLTASSDTSPTQPSSQIPASMASTSVVPSPLTNPSNQEPKEKLNLKERDEILRQIFGDGKVSCFGSKQF